MAGLARKVSFDDQIYMSDEDHQEEVPVPTQLRSCLTTFDERKYTSKPCYQLLHVAEQKILL